MIDCVLLSGFALSLAISLPLLVRRLASRRLRVASGSEARFGSDLGRNVEDRVHSPDSQHGASAVLGDIAHRSKRTVVCRFRFLVAGGDRKRSSVPPRRALPRPISGPRPVVMRRWRCTPVRRLHRHRRPDLWPGPGLDNAVRGRPTSRSPSVWWVSSRRLPRAVGRRGAPSARCPIVKPSSAALE